MNFCSICSGSSIHTMSLNSSGNIHWSCLPRSYTVWYSVMTTGWAELTFSVMDFTMLAAWCTVAGAFTGSVISGIRWLLVLNTVSYVLEKYPKKLIRSLTSSVSVANFNSHSLGSADADPSRKNESGSMSEETGGFSFPKTVGWISVYDTGSLLCFLLPELFASTLNESKLRWLSACWITDMVVPWKEDSAVAELVLWSSLSIAAVVNRFFFKSRGQTRPLAWYTMHTWLDIDLIKFMTQP